MNLHEKLAAVVRRENEQGELPDFIVPVLLRIAADPDSCRQRPELLATLIEQVEEYQTFSEMCCEKNGFGIEDIERTLKKLGIASRDISLPAPATGAAPVAFCGKAPP